MSGNTQTTTIVCTPDNLHEFRAAIARLPEVNALVKDLHAQGLLPGLRCVRIHLTGSPEVIAQGLGAVGAENASAGLQGDRHEN